MRSASTTERTEEIILKAISPNYRTALKLEIWDESINSWEIINDVDWSRGVEWTEAGKKEKYANYALTPLPGTVSFSIYNENGKYSDGSGTQFEGKIDKETKVRLQAGPLLNSLSDETETALTLNDNSGLFISSYFYHMEYDTSYVAITSEGLGSAPPHFKDQFEFYDAQNYDTTTYSLDAYTVQTYDTGLSGYEQINGFTVNCNTTNGTIYYRTLKDPTLTETSKLSDWTSAGATVSGNKTVSFTSTDRYLQVAITFDGITYTDDLRVNSISVASQSYVEFIYKSVYYLDRPSFSDPAAPEAAMIRCNGRDAYKRAVATDVNIEDLSTNPLRIGDLVENVCDQIGILYSATSIDLVADVGMRSTSTGVGVVKADKLFEYCMQAANQSGYVMYMQYDESLDDNILYLQPKPNSTDAAGAFSYKNYVSIGDVSKNSDRILQRMTIISDGQVPRAEKKLDQLSISSTGSYAMNWASTGGGEHEFKRFTLDLPDNITISNFESTPIAFTFDVDAVTGTVVATAYGSDWNADPLYEGEAFAIDNHIAGDGITSKIINPLVINDQECKDIAESFTRDYGSPVFEARNLTWPYVNILPELNDLFMLWRRFIFTNDVFFITKITHRWSGGAQPNESTTYNLEDTGLERETPFWDDNITQYDKGYIWDMGISTSLNTDAEIDAIADSKVIHNIGFGG
jgi:hypothetical protein